MLTSIYRCTSISCIRMPNSVKLGRSKYTTNRRAKTALSNQSLSANKLISFSLKSHKSSHSIRDYTSEQQRSRKRLKRAFMKFPRKRRRRKHSIQTSKNPGQEREVLVAHPSIEMLLTQVRLEALRTYLLRELHISTKMQSSSKQRRERLLLRKDRLLKRSKR